MKMMPSRYENLELYFEGLKQSGQPLVQHNGFEFVQRTGDSIGTFYFVPKIAELFNLSLDTSINLFFGFIIAFSFIFGNIFLFLSYKEKKARIHALFVTSVILALTIFVGGIYVVQSAAVMLFVPLVLFVSKGKLSPYKKAFLWFVMGLILGYFHLIRAHAETAIVLFSFIMLFHKKSQYLLKLGLIVSLVIGFLIPQFHIKYVIKQRDAYLSKEIKNYQPVNQKHVFWHSVFIGFGYLNNDLGISYDDNCAAKIVKEKDHEIKYCSPEYEKVLKQEVFNLIKERKKFVIETLAAKMGIILILLLITLNTSFIKLLRKASINMMDIAFWVAIAFSSLNGLLVMPRFSYLLGFIAICIYYGFYLSLKDSLNEDS